MFDEDGLGNYGTDAARTRKSGDGRDEMDEKDHEIARWKMMARCQQSRPGSIESPFKPCGPFSGTRLTDDLRSVACAG